MDILERFPLIAKVMYSEWESRTQADYSAHDDALYKKAIDERERLVSQLGAMLMPGAAHANELKNILYKLEAATDDMENIAEYYGFISGFKLCAKLMFEMME